MKIILITYNCLCGKFHITAIVIMCSDQKPLNCALGHCGNVLRRPGAHLGGLALGPARSPGSVLPDNLSRYNAALYSSLFCSLVLTGTQENTKEINLTQYVHTKLDLAEITGLEMIMCKILLLSWLFSFSNLAVMSDRPVPQTMLRYVRAPAAAWAALAKVWSPVQSMVFQLTRIFRTPVTPNIWSTVPASPSAPLTSTTPSRDLKMGSANWQIM